MDSNVHANAVLSIFCKNYMELKKGLPIRPSEMGVLNIIAETQGPHTPVMLAGLLGVSKPMITAHLTVLQSKGYITKEPSTEDKRACYILPTQKALELVALAKAELDAQLARLVDGMGRDAFHMLVNLAETANSILQ